IPNACYLGGDTGNYARKHNIFPLLSDVANDPTGQGCNNVPFTRFATDLANGTLPAFSNIVPNLCNDAHDCSLSTADSWLQTNIAPLIASPVFQQDGLLIIVFVESGGENTLGGGRAYWAAISPKSKRGYQSPTTCQHPSTLRLILKGLGVNVFPGASATAPDMSEFFNPLRAYPRGSETHDVQTQAVVAPGPAEGPSCPGVPRGTRHGGDRRVRVARAGHRPGQYDCRPAGLPQNSHPAPKRDRRLHGRRVHEHRRLGEHGGELERDGRQHHRHEQQR